MSSSRGIHLYRTVHGIIIVMIFFLSIVPPILRAEFDARSIAALFFSCLLVLFAAAYFLFLGYVAWYTPRSVKDMYEHMGETPSGERQMGIELIYWAGMLFLTFFGMILWATAPFITCRGWEQSMGRRQYCGEDLSLIIWMIYLMHLFWLFLGSVCVC